MPIIATTKQLKARKDNDNYPTPRELIEKSLDLFPIDRNTREVLDPGAGDGAWGKVIKERYPWVKLTGVEIRDIQKPVEYDYWFNMDFRCYKTEVRYDLVIGNPPYGKIGSVKVRGLAEKFVRQSIDLLNDGGKLVFLLRLAFLESQERSVGLWLEYPPDMVAVCSKRPSYTGNGKTDATAYGIYHWEKGRRGGFTKLTWLR